MKTDSKVVLGFLAGAAIGAIAGILFAPEKGSDTRQKIAKSTSDLGDNLKDSFNEFIDTVKHKYRKAKREAEDMVEKGEEKLSNLNKQLKNTEA
ncbi:MAG: YtxH domain-containing protein [Chitinophagaceae bacterium]|nr:YtxH domain-containing protein [Chitinophagaceae bacterium]MCW5926205.1 YtxH domain-containing protein [Chitinophagaceae bacterium]